MTNFSNTTLSYSRYSFNTDFGVNSTYTENNNTEIWDVILDIYLELKI